MVEETLDTLREHFTTFCHKANFRFSYFKFKVSRRCKKAISNVVAFFVAHQHVENCSDNKEGSKT
jgi:hypothetical protein